MRRAPLAVLVFAVWTEFVWISRVRNIVTADHWSGVELILPLVFVALGLAVLAVALAPTPPPVVTAVVRSAALVSSAVWVIRVAFIAVHDHPIGFKAVHVVLAAVSIALAAWAARSTGWVGDDRDAPATV